MKDNKKTPEQDRKRIGGMIDKLRNGEKLSKKDEAFWKQFIDTRTCDTVKKDRKSKELISREQTPAQLAEYEWELQHKALFAEQTINKTIKAIKPDRRDRMIKAALLFDKDRLTQREISSRMKISLGQVSDLLQWACREGYIKSTSRNSKEVLKILAEEQAERQVEDVTDFDFEQE